jgi:hypothetical protein
VLKVAVGPGDGMTQSPLTEVVSHEKEGVGKSVRGKEVVGSSVPLVGSSVVGKVGSSVVGKVGSSVVGT